MKVHPESKGNADANHRAKPSPKWASKCGLQDRSSVLGLHCPSQRPQQIPYYSPEEKKKHDRVAKVEYLG